MFFSLGERENKIVTGERCETGGAPDIYMELLRQGERSVSFKLRESLADFTLKPRVSCPPPGWGYNTVLMLIVSSQSLQSSMVCLLVRF